MSNFQNQGEFNTLKSSKKEIKVKRETLYTPKTLDQYYGFKFKRFDLVKKPEYYSLAEKPEIVSVNYNGEAFKSGQDNSKKIEQWADFIRGKFQEGCWMINLQVVPEECLDFLQKLGSIRAYQSHDRYGIHYNVIVINPLIDLNAEENLILSEEFQVHNQNETTLTGTQFLTFENDTTVYIFGNQYGHWISNKKTRRENLENILKKMEGLVTNAKSKSKEVVCLVCGDLNPRNMFADITWLPEKIALLPFGITTGHIRFPGDESRGFYPERILGFTPVRELRENVRPEYLILPVNSDKTYVTPETTFPTLIEVGGVKVLSNPENIMDAAIRCDENRWSGQILSSDFENLSTDHYAVKYIMEN